MTATIPGGGATLSSRLVVVDDDEFIHERVTRNLRGGDWVVSSFMGAEEALAHLRQGLLPGVLIVDNRMPRVSGVELLEQLAAEADLAAVRIYLSSEVRPLEDVCARVERLGVRVLSKDTLCDKKGLLRLLAAEDGAAAD